MSKIEICRFCNREAKFSKIPGRRVCGACFILKFVFDDEIKQHELCLVFKPNLPFNRGEIVHKFPYDMSYPKIKRVIYGKAAYLNDITDAATRKETQRRNNIYYNLVSKLDLPLPNELKVIIARFC